MKTFKQIFEHDGCSGEMSEEILNLTVKEILDKIQDKDKASEFANIIAGYLTQDEIPNFEDSLAIETSDDNDSFWVDPAGGTHSHDEDDPAAMYI
jgi:pyridoxal/pyridoxine/pyridoxamine kinase